MLSYAKGDYRALRYKFINSHDANVDISVEINRLELPLAVSQTTGASTTVLGVLVICACKVFFLCAFYDLAWT
jgi:hypothetical protein